MTRKQFLAELAKYPGVTLDTDAERDGDNLILDAPAGKRFVEGAHCMVEPYRNAGGQSWKGEAFAELVKRLAYGVVDCHCDDCSEEVA